MSSEEQPPSTTPKPTRFLISGRPTQEEAEEMVAAIKAEAERLKKS